MQLDINTVYLKEMGGRFVFFPDGSNQVFKFSIEVGRSITSLHVEGATLSVASTSIVGSGTNAANAVQPAGSIGAINLQSAVCRPSFSTPQAAARRLSSGSTFNLRIIQAKMTKIKGEKGVEFSKVGQIFTMSRNSV